MDSLENAQLAFFYEFSSNKQRLNKVKLLLTFVKSV